MEITFRKRSEKSTKGSKCNIRYSDIQLVGFNHLLVVYLYTHILVILWDSPIVSIKRSYYSLKTRLKKIRKQIIHNYKMRFDNTPIYYSLFSRDCDMCESTSYGKSNSYREHYNWLNDAEQWDWVEGATSVDEISRDEYLHYADEPIVVRDRIMEAFENGRGSSFYV